MSKPHLLLIDENACARRVVVRSLSEDFTVECVDDVEAALAAIDNGAQFGAILCGLQLAPLSGRRLRCDLTRRSPAVSASLIQIDGLSIAEIVAKVWEASSPRMSLPPMSAALAA